MGLYGRPLLVGYGSVTSHTFVVVERFVKYRLPESGHIRVIVHLPGKISVKLTVCRYYSDSLSNGLDLLFSLSDSGLDCQLAAFLQTVSDLLFQFSQLGVLLCERPPVDIEGRLKLREIPVCSRGGRLCVLDFSVLAAGGQCYLLLHTFSLQI